MAEARRSTEARRTELVDAALGIVATRGVAALTTSALAREVGLTSGAIFRHFASMEDLLEAVVGHVERVMDNSVPPETLPAIERLSRFVDARSSAVGGQLGILRLVLSDQFHLALPQAGSARLSACVGRTRGFVRRAIEDGQRDGTVRADLAADTLAPIVMGTVQMLALAPRTAARRAVRNGEVRDALLTLLRSSPPARAASRKRSV